MPAWERGRGEAPACAVARARSVRVLDASQPLSQAMCDILLDDGARVAAAPESSDRSEVAQRFDLSGVLLLVPGRALVRSLERGLLERSRSAGVPLVSPTFVTPARLASLVVDPFASEADGSRGVGQLLSETAERLVWRRAL